jgi:hypothetical protein
VFGKGQRKWTFQERDPSRALPGDWWLLTNNNVCGWTEKEKVLSIRREKKDKQGLGCYPDSTVGTVWREGPRHARAKGHRIPTGPPRRQRLNLKAV